MIRIDKKVLPEPLRFKKIILIVEVNKGEILKHNLV